MSIKELASLVDIHQIDLSGIVTTEIDPEVPEEPDFVDSDGDDNIVKNPGNESSNPENNPSSVPEQRPVLPESGNSDVVKDSGIPPQTSPESSEPAEEKPSENSGSAVTSDPAGTTPLMIRIKRYLLRKANPAPTVSTVEACFPSVKANVTSPKENSIVNIVVNCFPCAMEPALGRRCPSRVIPRGNGVGRKSW